MPMMHRDVKHPLAVRALFEFFAESLVEAGFDAVRRMAGWRWRLTPLFQPYKDVERRVLVPEPNDFCGNLLGLFGRFPQIRFVAHIPPRGW